MVVPQERLALILVFSFVLGLLFGFIFDFFRIRRLAFSEKLSKKRKSKGRNLLETAIVFIEDVLFSLICSVTICIFCTGIK